MEGYADAVFISTIGARCATEKRFVFWAVDDTNAANMEGEFQHGYCICLFLAIGKSFYCAERMIDSAVSAVAVTGSLVIEVQF